MAISFPASPSDEDLHSEGGATWQYSAAKNAWQVVARVSAALTSDDILDEDAMTSDDATKAPSQQSVKAYVTSQIPSAVVASVNEVEPVSGDVTLTTDDFDDSSQTNKFATATSVAAAGAVMRSAAVTESTTARTLTDADYDITVLCTNASQVTVTIPTDASDDLALGFNCLLVSTGAGGLTLSTTGITLLGSSPNTTIAQNEGLYVEKTAADTWLVLGGTS